MVTQQALTFAALLLGDRSRPLEVVEGEDVLQLSVRVHNRAAPVLLPLLYLIDQERLYVVRLFVAQKSRQILHSVSNRHF